MRKFKLVFYGFVSTLVVCKALCSTPPTLRQGGPYSTQEYVIDDVCLHSRGCFLPKPDGRGTYFVKRGRVLVGRSSFPVGPGAAVIWARTKPWMMYNHCFGALGPCMVYVDRVIGPSLDMDDLSRELVTRFASEHPGLRCAPYANVNGIAFLDDDSTVLVVVEYPRGGGCNSDPSLVTGFLVAVPSMAVQQELDAKELLVRFRPYLSRMIIGEILEEIDSRQQRPQ
ncbi:MAG: hypothetical protein ABSF23_15225 [Terracidiphilus sp.]